MRMRGVFAVLAVVIAVMTLPAVAGAQATPPGLLSVNPSSGPAGSSFTGSQDISFGFARSNCVDWFMLFDATVPSPHDANTQGPTRSATMQVPLNAAPGAHSVTSYCTDLKKGTSQVGSATFTVIGPETTTTTTTTSTTTTTVATTTTASTTTTVATTTTAKATTTTAKATATTAKATTTTPKATTTSPTTTSPTTTLATTTTAPSTTTTSTTTTAPTTTTTAVEVRDLALDKPSVAPGGDVKATGTGCDPGASVTLEIAGEQVGETTASSDGSFSTPIAVPDVDPGRLEVDAHCGPVLTTQLDIVLASSVAGGQSILLVIAISVLVLFGLLWYGLQSRRD